MLRSPGSYTNPWDATWVVSMARHTLSSFLPLAINRSAVFCLRVICSAILRFRSMVKSPAQSCRMRSLIHRGATSWFHVTGTSIRIPNERNLLQNRSEGGSEIHSSTQSCSPLLPTRICSPITGTGRTTYLTTGNRPWR